MKRFTALLFGICALQASLLSFAESIQQKAVLVTGANSGIGLRMTEQLTAKGFFVYAGVRREEAMAELNELENVMAVQFDVRDQKQIDAAAKLIEEQGKGLYGLINNAGVSVFGPIIEMPVDQLEYQMDVNVYGVVRVTQAFAPMIIESQGRIATTGSVAGVRSPAFMGAYSMSKHAIEAYTESLAQEMARFKVSVHVIEPAAYGTNIGNAARKRFSELNYWPETTRYQQEREFVIKRLSGFDQGPDPIDVAQAAVDLMTSEHPKFRYMVTSKPEEAHGIVRSQIRKAVQLNGGQRHELSKEELTAMLEEELGG